MRKHTTQAESLSTPKWETLEAWTRGEIQECVQALLEGEVAAAGVDERDDRGAAPAGAGPRGALREPGAAAVRAAD
jgi:hypothetical protein